MDDDLRKRLRKAARLQTKWRAERDELIRQANLSGASLREIADAVDLSTTGVLKITRKEGESPLVTHADIVWLAQGKSPSPKGETPDL